MDYLKFEDEGPLVAYFGYGSLVNRDTLRTKIVASTPARLLGWRRQWSVQPVAREDANEIALLTVHRDVKSGCDGMLIFDHFENLTAVDERERGYKRRRIDCDSLKLTFKIPADCPLYVYEADVIPLQAPLGHKILRSYLDAVMQGFCREYGRDGLVQFVNETWFFDIGIVEDRAAPRYPRSVILNEEERVLFDELIPSL